MQRHGGAGGAFAVEAAQLGLGGGIGRPLPEAVRGKMEAALGADFSGVRVHVGPQAERIGAIAFTVGSDVYFAPGRYQPETTQGQELLGHELAHVVQQRQGRVRNPFGGGLAVVQDRALEMEADRLGRQAAMHRAAPAVQAKLAPRWVPAAVQRMEEWSKKGKRDWQDQNMDYIVPSQPGRYEQHVAIRPWYAVQNVKKAEAVYDYGGLHLQNPALGQDSFTSVFSNTAEAQIGTGNTKATGGSLDAAHFQNFTIRSKRLSRNLSLTPSQIEAVDDLKIASAATSSQLKRDNVGPDKVIDSAQTEFIKKYGQLKASGQPLPSAATLHRELCDTMLKRLRSHKKSGNANYQAAIASIVQEQQNPSFDIENEVNAWVKQYGFK